MASIARDNITAHTTQPWTLLIGHTKGRRGKKEAIFEKMQLWSKTE